MSLTCPSPDPGAGVAVQLSAYLDCQARALGENGFQAIAGGALGMSMLSGLLTIFIAFIGYRLILGDTPGVRDGIGWAVRVGLVLALMTSWPAFQTVVFRVVVDGPAELARVVLPASGLPSEGLEWRIQQAYDTIRLGSAFDPGPNPDPSANPAAVPVQPAATQFQAAMPQTASLLVLSTSGFIGAFRIAVGFLLAVAPIAILCLLFDATLGIFAGWVRALGGMALATLAATIVAALDLMVVESQIIHLQTMRVGGGFLSVDPQALTTAVFSFAVVMLVTTFAAMRMTSAFRLRIPRIARQSSADSAPVSRAQNAVSVLQAAQEAVAVRTHALAQTRVAAVADALSATTRREQALLIDSGATTQESRSGYNRATSPISETGFASGLGTRGRRAVGRRTQSAMRRDKSG